MQGVAWYLEEREWNPGRREGLLSEASTIACSARLAGGICAERLEVSREGANRQLGAEGKTGVPRSGVLFGDTGSGKSVSWGGGGGGGI